MSISLSSTKMYLYVLYVKQIHWRCDQAAWFNFIIHISSSYPLKSKQVN